MTAKKDKETSGASRSHFLPYQRRWLDDHAQIKVWEKSRRVGATYTQAYEDVRDLVKKTEYTKGRPITRVYFSSKDDDAGKEYIEYCLKYAKVFNIVAVDTGVKVVDEITGVKAKVLEFENGGRIFALTSAPTAFNSKGGKIVWDEAALHKDQKTMWSGAMPAATVWGYPIRILSTHKGKSTLFYKFCNDIRKGKRDWSLHKVTIQDAVNEGLYDKVTGRKTTHKEQAHFIETLRANCASDDMFMEDFMAEPVDATTAFIPYELIEAVENEKALSTLERLSLSQNPLYAGWDIGRKKDLSVVVVLEDVGGFMACRIVEEFNRVPFRTQKSYLDKIMRLPGLRRICIDQTGMGLPLTEEAQDMYGRYTVEGVNFTAQTKEAMAVNVRHMLEDRRMILPPHDALKESMHSIKRIVTAAGNIRFDAERTDETGHADHFWALALALHAKTGGPSGPTWALSKSDTKEYDKFMAKIPFHQY